MCVSVLYFCALIHRNYVDESTTETGDNVNRRQIWLISDGNRSLDPSHDGYNCLAPIFDLPLWRPRHQALDKTHFRMTRSMGWRPSDHQWFQGRIYCIHMHYTHDYMWGACCDINNCPWLASCMVGESKPAYWWANSALILCCRWVM